MGMFDYIKCKYPLPEITGNERTYQTSDTPNQLLDEYVIKENGLLFVWEYDLIKECESVGFGNQYYKRINTCLARVYFTGRIRLYDFYYPDEPQGWIEFITEFNEGQLFRADLVRLEIPTKQERLKRRIKNL